MDDSQLEYLERRAAALDLREATVRDMERLAQLRLAALDKKEASLNPPHAVSVYGVSVDTEKATKHFHRQTIILGVIAAVWLFGPRGDARYISGLLFWVWFLFRWHATFAVVNMMATRRATTYRGQ